MHTLHGIDKLHPLQNSAQNQSLMPRHNQLTATGLSCIRGDNTLFSDLDVKVSAGECLHLIGANGSGKTSLLRILCGLRTPDQGSIAWNDTAIKQSEKFQAESAYLAHKDGLKNELTATENLSYYQRLEGLNDNNALDERLHQLGILQCADLFAHQLSFGQRRRLAFARLLLKPYDIWFLDEPFTGVDADGRAVIEGLCTQHVRNLGCIVMTHHQSLANSPLAEHLCELRLTP